MTTDQSSEKRSGLAFSRREVLGLGALGAAAATIPSLAEALGASPLMPAAATAGTWTQISSIGQVWFLDFAFGGPSPRQILGGCDDSIGIYSSSTGNANSWSRLKKSSSTPLDVSGWSLSRSPADSSLVIASDNYGRGIVRSLDGGATWASINSGLPTHNGKWPLVPMVQVSPHYSGTVAWAAVARKHPGDDNQTEGGLYICTNINDTVNPPTWTRWANASALDGLDVQAVFHHPDNASIILVGVGGKTPSVNAECQSSDLGVYRYNGSTWSGPITNTAGAAVAGFAYDPTSKRVWASLQEVTSGGVTVPGGVAYAEQGSSWATWTRCTGLPSGGSDHLYVWGVAADPRVSNLVYAITITLAGGGTTANVFVSTNGTSFSACTALQTGGALAIGLGVHPTVGSTWGDVYVGTYGQGLFRSTDKGSTWSRVDAGMSHAYSFGAVRADPNYPDTLVMPMLPTVDDSTGIYVTGDGGANWVAADTTGSKSLQSFYEVAHSPHTPGRLLAVSSGPPAGKGLWESDDYGLTWVRHDLPSWDSNPPDPPCGKSEKTQYVSVAFHPTDDEIAWVGTSQGLSKITLGATINDEPTWGSLQLTGKWISAIRYLPSTPYIFFVATGGAKFGAYNWNTGFYRTTNDGVSFTQCPFLGDGGGGYKAGYDVLFAPAAWGSAYENWVYFVHRGGLTLSPYAGLDSNDTTLVTLRSNAAHVGTCAAIDPAFGVFYAGYDYIQSSPTDIVYSASDGTGSWSSIATGLPTREVTALGVYAPATGIHRLFASTDGAGFWSYEIGTT